MRPEEIEELLHRMNQQKIAYTVTQEGENGDDTIPQPIEGEPEWSLFLLDADYRDLGEPFIESRGLQLG